MDYVFATIEVGRSGPLETEMIQLQPSSHFYPERLYAGNIRSVVEYDPKKPNKWSNESALLIPLFEGKYRSENINHTHHIIS